MANLLSRSEAEALTKPCHAVWVEAHLRAMKLWRKQLTDHPEFTKPFGPSERATILHSHITDHAATNLDGAVVSTKRLAFFAQIIGERALVRFKLLDSTLRPSSYPTEQQDSLDRQEFTDEMMEQLKLDGLNTGPTLLTCGYTLTPAADAISRVVVVCHRGRQTLYAYDLLGGEGMEVVRFPGSEPDQPRVVSKRAREEQTKGSREDHR